MRKLAHVGRRVPEYQCGSDFSFHADVEEALFLPRRRQKPKDRGDGSEQKAHGVHVRRLSEPCPDRNRLDDMGMSSLRCKACHGEMVRGYAHIHGLFFTFFAVGPGTATLRFEDRDHKDRTEVLGDGAKQVAFRCLGCGAIVITPHQW